MSQGQRLEPIFPCKTHNLDYIQRLKIDANGDASLHCLECLVSSDSERVSITGTITFKEFVEKAVEQFQAYKQLQSLENSVPSDIQEHLSQERVLVEQMEQHIQGEKEKVSNAFIQIENELRNLCQTRKQEICQELDKQLSIYKSNFNYYKRLVEKTYEKQNQPEFNTDVQTLFRKINSCNDTDALERLIHDICRDKLEAEALNQSQSKVNELKKSLNDFIDDLRNESPVCHFKESIQVEELLNKLREKLQPLLKEIPEVENEVWEFPSGKLDSKLLKSNSAKLLHKWGLEQKKLKLLYRASRDGFSANDFHSKCDNQQHTLVVVKSKLGMIFGGYSDQRWNHSANYTASQNTWLFSLDRKEKYPIKNPHKSISEYSTYGPTFGGGHDFYICSDSDKKQDSYSNFGHSYELGTVPQNEKQIALAGEYQFLVKEIEVFCIMP